MINPPIHLPIQKASLEHNASMGGFDLFLASMSGPTSKTIILPPGPLAFRTFSAGEYIEPQPFASFSEQSAQALLDALYAAGLRPSSGDLRPSASNRPNRDNNMLAVDLMKEHIADLRRIVFGREEIMAGQSNDVPRSLTINDHL